MNMAVELPGPIANTATMEPFPVSPATGLAMLASMP